MTVKCSVAHWMILEEKKDFKVWEETNRWPEWSVITINQDPKTGASGVGGWPGSLQS